MDQSERRVGEGTGKGGGMEINCLYRVAQKTIQCNFGGIDDFCKLGK